MHPRTRIHGRMLLAAGLLLAGLCAAPSTGLAYDMTGAGGKLGIISPEDLDNTVMIGGHLEFENDSRFHLVPNLMYWRVDRTSDVNPNFDVYYHFNSQDRTSPYLGGGLGLNVTNSDLPDRSNTSLGANVIGGVRFPGASNHYFVEGRFTASDVSQVAVVGGITFNTH
ncbi:MAG TPA: outer membrane beta-barrel protein [Candidatus Eisenbacteria bacterium]